MLSFASAGLFDPNSEIEFHEEGKNGKWGYYEINSTDLWFFNNKPVKTIELIENDYSILTAWNIKEIEVFRPTKLFDKTNYLDKEQKNDRSNLISSETHLYREWETKTRTISDFECLTYETSVNGTQECSEYQDNSYEEEYEEWSSWKLYNFQTVQEGLYQTKTIVTRDSQTTGAIDWVDENEGWDLSEWLTWWDTDWGKKREINITENSADELNNYSVLLFIPYDSSMKTDFSDLRFLNSAEDTELSYYVENKTDSNFAWIWIKVPTLTASSTTSTYMYYANSIASSNSDIFSVYFFYDDFDDNDYTDKWDVVSGSWTEAGGTLTHASTSSYQYMTSKIELDDGINYMIDTKLKLGTEGVIIGGSGAMADGSQWLYYQLKAGDDLRIGDETNGITTFSAVDPLNGVDYWTRFIINGTIGTPHVYVRIYTDEFVTLLANGEGQDTSNAQADGRKIILKAYNAASFDYILVRKFVDPEPTYSIGEEQQNEGFITNLISPENNQNILNNTVTFNFTSTPIGTNLTNATLYIWHINGTLADTNFTTLSGNESINTNFINFLIDGMYKWNVETCGVGTSCSFASSNNSFIVHVTPITIEISEPNGTIEFIELGNNQTLSWSLTEPGENITEHITNCSYTYNSVITYLPLINCTLINTTNFEYVNGVNTLIFNTTDIFNLTSNQTTTWEYKIVELNQTWPDDSVESATEIYTANISYNSSIYPIATAVLNLNGSSYSGTKTDDGDITTFSANVIMPSILTQTNFTGYWTISLTDDSDTYDFNLSSTNVTIIPIELALCNGGNNIPFWNFTILNETNDAEVLSNFVSTFAVRKEGSSTNNYFNFSDTSSSKSQFDFCITPSEESYTIDTTIQISKTGFVTKSYNYEDVTVTNATREDDLYMMTNEDSTSFIVHVVYISAIDIGDAEVMVQRYYPGTNQWVTTEIITTNDVGTAIGHILSEDADYRFKVYKDGVSIHNSSSTKIICTVSPCTVTLVVPLDVATGIEEVENLSSTLTYGSDIFTYTYSDTSGSFSNARLFVIRLAPSNSTIVTPCDISKTSSSGVLLCDISGFINGTYQATGYITRDGAEFMDLRINGALGDKIYDAMGDDGVLWAIFIFIGIVMLGMKRPSLAIIFGIFGFVIMALIQIINIGVISIVAIVTIGIILLVRIGRE